MSKEHINVNSIRNKINVKYVGNNLDTLMVSETKIVKQKPCFKNRGNPSCKDLSLSNSTQSFQISSVFKTGSLIFENLQIFS